MPVELIKDPETGRERLVYVPAKGMGAQQPERKAQPQPQQQPKPQFGGIVGGLVSGAQAALRGEDFGAAWERGVRAGLPAPVAEPVLSAGRTLGYAGQRVLQSTAQTAASLPTTQEILSGQFFMPDGRQAAAEQRRMLAAEKQAPVTIKPANDIEKTTGDILSFIPVFLGTKGAIAPMTKGVSQTPGISRLVQGAEEAVTKLKATGLPGRAAGRFAQEAVEGAVPSAVATYFWEKRGEESLTDKLYKATKGTPFEGVVIDALRSDPNDTVQQQRTKAALNDLVWSVPLGGAIGTGFRGLGALAGATKAKVAEVLDGMIRVAQAEQVAKATPTPTPLPTAVVEPQAAIEPNKAPLPAGVTPPTTRVTGRQKGGAAAQAQEALTTRTPRMWETTGVEIQQPLDVFELGGGVRRGEPQAPVAPAAPAPAPKQELAEIEPPPASERTVDIQAIPGATAVPDPWGEGDAMANYVRAVDELDLRTKGLQAEVARETWTAPEAPVRQEGELPGMQQPGYTQVMAVPTAEMFTAPQVLQYKEEGRLSKTGRSGSLVDEEEFSYQLAGVVSAWRDVNGELGPAGRIYVVNGHNRLELAKRAGAPVVNVQMLDVPTAKEARTIGALQNIADDKGTSIDAAKIFRDTGMGPDDLRQQRISISGQKAAEGLALSRLPQWLFDKTVAGELSISKGVALGSVVADETVTSEVAKQAIKGNWSADKIAQAMQEAQYADTRINETSGPTLPGMEEWNKQTNVMQLVEIRTAAFRLLGEEVRALTAASRPRNTQYLEGAGNVINVEGSMAARRAAADAVATFNRVAGYEGAVRDILNELAAAVPEGKGAAAAASQLVQANLQRLRDAIAVEIQGPKLPLEAPAAPAARGAEAPVAEAPVPEAAVEQPTLEMPAPEGNPTPVGEKVTLASKGEKERIERQNNEIPDMLRRLEAAEARGNTELATQMRAWLAQRGVYPPMPEQQAAEVPAVGTPAAVLPPDLAGLKPRYSYGQKRFQLTFETDLDRVAYTLAGDATGKASKSHQKYRDWLEANGLDPAAVAQYGAQVVKPSIKEMARTSQPGNLQVRDMGFGGSQFAAELPDLSGWMKVETSNGTVGEAYTGQLKIPAEQQRYLESIARKVAGGDVNLRLVERINEVYGPSQAAAYGVPVGTPANPRGMFQGGRTMADDLITIAMVSYDRPISFARQIASTFHESFHRLQRWFLDDQEQKALALGEDKIRALAAKSNPAARTKYMDGTIDLKEATAEAFAGYARGLGPAPVKGFEKIKKMLDQVVNAIKGAGFQTWDDVFERAATGQMAERGPRLGANGQPEPQVQFAVDPPDPEEFARRVEQNMGPLESGEMTLEELTQMQQSDVRRLSSPSGSKPYISGASAELIAGNRALGEMLRSRAQATGIRSFSTKVIINAAIDQLRRSNMEVDLTLDRLEASGRGDVRSQEDLIALTATVIHRDHLAAGNAMTALQWQQSVDEADRAEAMQRLWAGLEDQTRLDNALMTVTRKDGQRLRVMQIRHNYDPTMLELPAGSVLYHGTTKDSAESILDNGFKESGPGSDLLGRGVYFTSNESYAGAYGDTALYGDTPRDVRILDLVAMDKRVTDLLKEIGIGRPAEVFDGERFLTQRQGAMLRKWAVDQGYDGIRYNAMFDRKGSEAINTTEVVIYDANTANRIVGSDVAVQPDVPLPPETVDETVATELADPANTLLGKIDPEIRADIEAGNLTPESEGMTRVLVEAVVAGRQSPGFAAKFASTLRGVDANRLNQEMVLQAYRAALLWSPKTWLKMLGGSAYRAVTLPLAQAIPALADATVQATTGSHRAAYQSLRRAGLDMQIYMRYASNLSNAWRLVGESWKVGENLGNLGASSMEMAQKGLDEVEQLRLDGSEFAETNDVRNTMDNPWYLNPETTGMEAIATRFIWRALNVSGRVSGSLDTFFSSIIGPSTEWARRMDIELERAEGRGLTGDTAWEEASKIVDDQIESSWRDVIINGRAIKDGALTGIHAKTAMDWINFTDDLDVNFQPRTYEYGVRKAREQGLTDVGEINAKALEWMNGEPDKWTKAGMGVAKTVSLAPKLYQDAVSRVPVLGMIQAFNRGPTNIVKAAMRASGFAAPFVDTFWRDINSEDVFTRERAMGEIAVGYMTVTAAVLMATSGYVQLSGVGSYNSRVREKMRNEGIQPFSIRFANPQTGEFTRWWDLQAFDTVSNIFAAVGTYMSLANSMPVEDREALAGSLALTAAEAVRVVGVSQFTKDMYSGIGEIFGSVTDAVDKSFVPEQNKINPFSAMIQQRLAGFLPAIFRNVRKGADPFERVIQQSSLPMGFGFFHELAQRYANQIPGLSSQLEPRLHPLTGMPITVDQVWGTQFIPPDQPWLKGLVQGFSPTAISPTRMGSTDPVDNELARLSGRGTSFLIWSANEFKVPNFKLSYEQLNKLSTIASQYIPPGRQATLHGSLTSLFAPGSPYWELPVPEPSRATESARSIQVNREINYYKPFILKEFLATEPGLARMVEEIESTRIRNQVDATLGVRPFVESFR